MKIDFRRPLCTRVFAWPFNRRGMKKTFLILHGWGGSHPGHWQYWLYEALKSRGEEVLFPTLPHPDRPQLDEWLAALEDILHKKDTRDFTVVTHSLSGALWLHYIMRYPEHEVESIYLVAPTPDDCGISELKSFFPLPEMKLQNGKAKYLMVASNNDAYISGEKFRQLAEKLAIPLKILPEVGHVNVASGFGPWPWILEKLLGKTGA